MRHLIVMLTLALACSPTLAADTKKEPTEKQKAQQQRMKDCSAKSKGMKGAEHEKFMSTCLSGKDAPAPTAKAPTQQEKMTSCNKDASAKALKGKDRENFMSSCLKG